MSGEGLMQAGAGVPLVLGENRFLPHPFLRPLIQSYKFFSLPAGSRDHWQKVIPTAYQDVILLLDGGLQYSGPGDSNAYFLQHGGALGLHTRYYHLRPMNALQMIVIRMRPQGLSRLMGLPEAGLVNTLHAIDPFDGAFADLLTSLRASTSWQSVFSRLDQYFLECLGQTQRQPSDRISDTIDLMLRTAGQVSSNELADKACVSSRQFLRLFTDEVGLTPKLYSRLVRISSVLTRAAYCNGPLNQWLSAAGYYDYSHLHRDFDLVAGETPTHFLKQMTPLSKLLIG